MAYVFPRNENYHIRVYKIHIGTPDDKTQQGQSDFNYDVLLKEQINDVIGIELVDWSFPRDLIPTFYPPTTSLAGNNRLDFRLQNPDIDGGAAADFVVDFPTKYYDYQNYADPTRDYTVMVAKTINDAIASNPTWADQVLVTLIGDAFLHTLVIVSTTGPGLPADSETTLTFMFLTGPNTARGAYITMGWPDPVDAASSKSVYKLPPGSQALRSPSPVILRSALYLDVFVEESPQKPIARIFFDDPAYTTNRLASDSVGRFEIDKDTPPRLLRRLRIRLRYNDDFDPGDFISGPIIAPHYLTFHVLAIQNETDTKPASVEQNLFY